MSYLATTCSWEVALHYRQVAASAFAAGSTRFSAAAAAHRYSCAFEEVASQLRQMAAVEAVQTSARAGSESTSTTVRWTTSVRKETEQKDREPLVVVASFAVARRLGCYHDYYHCRRAQSGNLDRKRTTAAAVPSGAGGEDVDGGIGVDANDAAASAAGGGESGQQREHGAATDNHPSEDAHGEAEAGDGADAYGQRERVRAHGEAAAAAADTGAQP